MIELTDIEAARTVVHQGRTRIRCARCGAEHPPYVDCAHPRHAAAVRDGGEALAPAAPRPATGIFDVADELVIGDNFRWPDDRAGVRTWRVDAVLDPCVDELYQRVVATEVTP